MKKIILSVMFMLSLLSISKTVKKEDIYPKAEQGMVKHIVILDEKADEGSYLIKLKFGREEVIDCNQHFLIDGKIEEKVLEGYGYTYYEFKGSDKMASTLMACGTQAKTKKDVFYNSEEIIRYNSKLPVVIYAPKDVFVNYTVYEKIVDEKLK